MNTSVVQRLASVLGEARSPCDGVTNESLLRLAGEALGDDMHRFPDGRMLIWDIARHDGYTIPPYPMAGCGDVREFLRDEGARNVPEWYERHLGIDRNTYDDMYMYELVMVRNVKTYRRVWLVPAQSLETDAAAVLRYVAEWTSFALSKLTSEQDPRLFKR